MVGRQENDLTKRLCYGDILFYGYLQARRNPAFLDRNLRRVLQLHQEEVERAEKGSCVNSQGFEHHNRALWIRSGMPSRKMIEDEQGKQCFRLLVKSITPIDREGNVFSKVSKPPKKTTQLFRIPISLYATIFDRENPGIHVKTFNDHEAVIIGNGVRAASIGTEFSAKLDEFKLPPGEGQSIRKGMATQYDLLISLNFKKGTIKEAGDEVLQHMGQDHPQIQDGGSSRWTATFKDIYKCPANGIVIPLFVKGVGSTKHCLSLGLEIIMCWTSPPGESILAATNKQLKAKLPKVQPKRRSKQSACSTKITFSFMGKEVTNSELKCALCPNRISFQNLDELHMHVKTSHDMFNFRVTKDKEVGQTQYWRFESDVAEHKITQRASDRAPDPRELQVLAPRRPFNRRKYLDEGNEQWQKEARMDTSVRPSLPKSVPSESIIRRKDPTEIQPRINRERKKYRVPKAPQGVVFFRAHTKRPVLEGEYISESDDDADMEWLRLKTESVLMGDPNMPMNAKRFLQGFDQYIRDERLQSDVHVGDSLIRFAHEKGAWLQEEDLIDEFKQKVAELLDDQIISKDVHDACAATVERQPIRPDEQRRLFEEPSGSFNTPPRTPLSHTYGSKNNEGSASNRADGGGTSETISHQKAGWTGFMNKGKAKVTDLGQTTPLPTDYDGDVEMIDILSAKLSAPPPEYEKCLCGHQAMVHNNQREQVIYCENDDCIRHGFHIDCVLRKWQPKAIPDSSRGDWYCRDCEGDADIDTGRKTWYDF